VSLAGLAGRNFERESLMEAPPPAWELLVRFGVRLALPEGQAWRCPVLAVSSPVPTFSARRALVD